MKRSTVTTIIGSGALALVAWWTAEQSAAAGRAPQNAQRTAGALTPPSAAASAPVAPEAAASPPAASAPAPTPEQSYLDIPDLTQTDPELDLPGGGNSYCGPVAISNSLMRLGAERCPRLVPEQSDPKAAQLELVRRLSSSQYMATSPTHGTGGMNLMEGLHRYLVSHGCGYRRFAYQGWRGHPPQFSTGVRTPQLAWIGKALALGGAAFINVGWYHRTSSGRAYRRNGGHWLTVVAAGLDETGAPDPAMLVLHDPAPYAGAKPADEYARAELVDAQWLVEGRNALPAKGYYRLTGGMHIKRPGEAAILDGAIVLVP